MLSKKNLINKDKDFDRAFKTGQSFYSRILGAKAVNNDLGFNRFGILISSKISKKAVVRNRIRRQLKAIIKQEDTKLNVGRDVVLIALPGIVDKNFQDIFSNIKTIFNNLRLYR
jgi:ribonuclease P protein component